MDKEKLFCTLEQKIDEIEHFTPHSWSWRQARGQQGEALFQADHPDVIDLRDDASARKDDVDLYVCGKWYEIKTDSIAPRTGNVCIEVAKIDNTGYPDYSRGWFNYSKADVFVFYLFDYDATRITRQQLAAFAQERRPGDALHAYTPVPIRIEIDAGEQRRIVYAALDAGELAEEHASTANTIIVNVPQRGLFTRTDAISATAQPVQIGAEPPDRIQYPKDIFTVGEQFSCYRIYCVPQIRNAVFDVYGIDHNAVWGQDIRDVTGDIYINEGTKGYQMK